MEITFQKLDTELPTPQRAHVGDAGIDLYGRVDLVLAPGERAAVPTGIAVAIPDGYAGLVVPRSGLALRHGVGVVNGPGLIDPGYRGEVQVLLVNHGSETIELRRGDRVAQLVVVAVPAVQMVESAELPRSDRGEGGFGSTGA
jgi:dUTP pyrophosphatase